MDGEDIGDTQSKAQNHRKDTQPRYNMLETVWKLGSTLSLVDDRMVFAAVYSLHLERAWDSSRSGSYHCP